MTDKAFRFKIGDFACMVVSDGTITDGDLPPGRQPQTHHVNCLYIDTSDNKVLMDTGCGGIFQSTAGKLAARLEDEGVRRRDIDFILVSHGHLDHVGGCFDKAGQPLYPGARYVTFQKEWDCWVTPVEKTDLQRIFFADARRNLLPRREQFDLVAGGVEWLPGIRLLAAPGHTPGLMMAEIASGGQALFCLGDIIHSPLEFSRPDYYEMFDVDPAEAVRTREKALGKAADSGTLTFVYHFAFPGLGYIIREGNIFAWRPASLSAFI